MKNLLIRFNLTVLILVAMPMTVLGGWEEQNSGVTTSLYGISAIDEQQAVSVGASGTIIRTETGGELWIPSSSGVTSTLMAVYFLDENYGWASGAGGIILASTDGGESWTPQSSGITQYVYYVHFVDSQTGWACGQEGFILHSTNGGDTWGIQSSGVTVNLWSIRFANDQVGWTVGQEGTILGTTNGGDTWTPQVSGTSNYLQSVYCIDENTVWAVGAYGTVLKTTNGGTDWVLCNSGTSGWLYQVCFSDADHGWAVARYGEIIATTDGGDNWYPQISGTPSVVLRSVSMVSSSVGWISGTSGTILYTSNGGMESPLEITLTPVNPPIQIPASGGSFDFEALIVNLTDSTVTYDVWTHAVLPNSVVYPLIAREDVMLAAEDTLFRVVTQAVPVGAPSGLYTYQGFVGDYPDVMWDESSFDFEKLATDFGGDVYTSWTVSSWDTENLTKTSKSADQTGLLSAYPNPFNPEMTFSYRLPEAARVQLQIFNLQGRLIATLVDRVEGAGEHSLEFNGAHLPSGMYFYTLETGLFHQDGKLLLLK